MHPSPGRPLHRLILLSLLLLALAGPAAVSARQDEPEPTPEPTPMAIEGAPVVVNGQELFRLHARVGSVTATERATLVAERISRLANNPFVGPVTIAVLDVQGATDIVAGDQVLVTVTDSDAAAEGRDRQELAQEWATIIQASIAAGQAGLSVEALTAGLGVTLGVLLALILLLWLINRFGNWLVDKLDPSTESGRLPPALAASEFYQTGQFSRLVRALLRVFKVALAVFFITVAIPVILRSFPAPAIWANAWAGHCWRRWPSCGMAS